MLRCTAPSRLGTGKPGRPRKRGARRPAAHCADGSGGVDPARGQPAGTASASGRSRSPPARGSGTGAGVPGVWLRWIVVRDPIGATEPKGFLCTDPSVDPAVALGWYLRRWSVEVTFAEVRRHLGVETQRQWSDLAIARTTPCLLGLFSVVALAADQLHGDGALSARQSRWYTKEAPSFSDALAAVRLAAWRGLSTSRAGHQSVEIPEAVLWQITSTLAYAA